MGPLRSSFGFRRGMPFDVLQWGNERDLKFDPLTTQGWSGRHRRDLGKRTRELLYCLDKR